MQQFILSFLGLALLQIVLSVDNVIFLSIVTSKLDKKTRDKARKIGVLISIAMNAVLISMAGFLSAVEKPLLTVVNREITLHDLIMVSGGLFLMYKAVKELYNKVEHKDDNHQSLDGTMMKIVGTMALIDFVFSIDSTITAIGMSNDRTIQVGATLLAIVAMYFFFVPISRIVEKHASIKILALAFLILIGFCLFADGLGGDVPKGYVYMAMAFSLIMEAVNIRHDKKKRRKNTPYPDYFGHDGVLYEKTNTKNGYIYKSEAGDRYTLDEMMEKGALAIMSMDNWLDHVSKNK